LRASLGLPVQGDGRIQGNPVHPGTELGIPPEFRISLPELYGDFLEQVVMRIPVVRIEAAYFMNNILIVLKFRDELVLELLIHFWLVVLNALVAPLGVLLQKKGIGI
jgi:hypothetical protein